jgi:hypothetical protein
VHLEYLDAEHFAIGGIIAIIFLMYAHRLWFGPFLDSVVRCSGRVLPHSHGTSGGRRHS